MGVLAIFFIVGFVMAAWFVNIPAVQARTQVSHSTLGILLLVLGLGAVISMQIAGLLITRFGSKTVAIIAVSAAVVSINLPASAGSALSLGFALLVFGLANGASEVAMNAQAVLVERKYGRPIMSAFHAMWSIGGATGALLGALAQTLDWDVRVSVLVAAVIAAALASYFLRLLLPADCAGQAEVETAASTSQPTPPTRRIRLRVFAFGVLAFLMLLVEGVANDWGPLHAVEHLRRSEASASLAFGTFAVAMTVGRLTIDRVAQRIGPRAVVRFGSLVAAAGIGVVVISTAYPLTLLGWTVYGLGLAGIVPQVFTAAGNLPTSRPSVVLARVVGAGYVGVLAGPALIGFIGAKVGLGNAFLLPLIFCLVGVVLAGTLDQKESATSPLAAPDKQSAVPLP